MKIDWSSRKFILAPSEGDLALIPPERTWKIKLHKITADSAVVLVNGEEKKDVCGREGTTLTVTLAHIKPEDRVEIILPEETEISENPGRFGKAAEGGSGNCRRKVTENARRIAVQRG